ncbi:hypothetical protein HK104_002773 [Borealophlyctis nickersoniae]|nr:hypothetical protein HK104_002773 [Borealophlyctis nickersoniae]
MSDAGSSRTAEGGDMEYLAQNRLEDDYDDMREQDRYLPIANVARIMKRALPENAKIAKDAKECVQECVSEFISFITSEASDRCQQEKRKTVNGEDILWAMQSLGFENYCETLKVYLHKYREVMIAIGVVYTTKLERSTTTLKEGEEEEGQTADEAANAATVAANHAALQQLQLAFAHQQQLAAQAAAQQAAQQAAHQAAQAQAAQAQATGQDQYLQYQPPQW